MLNIFKLPKVSAKIIAEDTKNIIVNAIASNTGLPASMAATMIWVTGNDQQAQVRMKNTGIPIHNFQPSYNQSSPSRASITADTSMTAGAKLIRGAFRNPIAQINARRRGKARYPIIPVYGPSVSKLFQYDKTNILAEVDAKIGAYLTNG